MSSIRLEFDLDSPISQYIEHPISANPRMSLLYAPVKLLHNSSMIIIIIVANRIRRCLSTRAGVCSGTIVVVQRTLPFL